MAAETKQEVFENAAGLLMRHGYAASVVPNYSPKGHPRPVTALVTDAPPVILGYALSQVAINPEPFLPTRSTKVARTNPGKAGDPKWAWWSDKEYPVRPLLWQAPSQVP